MTLCSNTLSNINGPRRSPMMFKWPFKAKNPEKTVKNDFYMSPTYFSTNTT